MLSLLLALAMGTGSGPGTTITFGGPITIALVDGGIPVTGDFYPAVQPVQMNGGWVVLDAGVTVTNFPASQPVTGTFYQATQPVSLATAPTTPVTGTFYQATQPVSIASMPSTPVTGTFWPATQPVSQSGNWQAWVNVDGGTVAVSNFPASQPVTGTFFQATQPVSLATAPTTPVTGTFWQSTQPVSVASMPSTPVTGTFFQATQPVSLATAPTTPVTGTFWQATQPVSGTVAVSSAPTTAVTGTFFQATQPVSIASMPSTPVTGTFFQATQPVSAASLPLPSGASTAAKQPALGTAGSAASDVITVQGVASMTAIKTDGSGVTQPVSGTFFQATQPVSIASMPSTPVTGTFFQATQPVSVVGNNPCQNPSSTLLGVSGSTSGTTAVQVIAASGATKIYLCSMTVTGVSGTTPTFSLVTGTGTNCATGQVVLMGAWTTTANTIYPFAPPVAITPSSSALCYLDTGTTPIQRYTITYVQQ